MFSQRVNFLHERLSTCKVVLWETNFIVPPESWYYRIVFENSVQEYLVVH